MLPFGNISERIFTHTASHYACKHTTILAVWQGRKCRRYAGSPPPSYRHSRATECARLQQETTRRKLVAKPRTPHFHSAGRAALQASNSQCRGSRGNAPRPSLGDTKGVFSLRREYPLCLRAVPSALPFMHVPYRETLSPEARSCRGRRAHGSAGAARSAPPARRCWTRRGNSRCPFPW